MGLLNGKVAVVTGGSRGLGLAIARAYAQEGAKVVLASRSSRSVEAAVAELQASGAQAAGLACDVADLKQVEALGELALSQFGRIDIWVNNAALSAPYGPVTGIAPAAFTAATMTNVLGTYNGSLVAMRHFLPQRQGKLINLLGMGDRKPVPNQAAYASSKSWIRSFTLALAREHKESGVGIFAFNPGLILTDLVTDVEVVPGWEEKVKALPVVLRLFGNPPEVPAARALWLASPATDGRTGSPGANHVPHATGRSAGRSATHYGQTRADHSVQGAHGSRTGLAWKGIRQVAYPPAIWLQLPTPRPQAEACEARPMPSAP